MKTKNYILDRSVFVFTWLTIVTISTTLATVFFVGVKTIIGT